MPEGIMQRLVDGHDAALREYWQQRVERHFGDEYAGLPLLKFPEDLRTYEQLIWERRPQVVLEIGTHEGGSALWLRDRLLDAQRYRSGPSPFVISVDIDSSLARENIRHLPVEARVGIELIEGDVGDPGVQDRVLCLVPPGAEVLVIEDAAHDHATTLAALRAFAPLVREGGYFVVEDTCVDVETLRLTDEWPRGAGRAVSEWLADDPVGAKFERSPEQESYGLTCHPGGFLRRVAG